MRKNVLYKLFFIYVALCSASFSYGQTTRVVSSTSDNGMNTLRQAVLDANPGDTIVFSPAINNMPILLDSQIVVPINLTFIGNDTTNTIIDGQDTTRMFVINRSVVVNIAGIKFQNGEEENAQIPDDDGAAIYSEGHLTVDASLFVDNNNLERNGGAIYQRDFTGTDSLTVLNSCFINNYAEGDGGAIYVSEGDTRVEGCIFTNNTSRSDGGAFVMNVGLAHMFNSLFDRNASLRGSGGAITSRDSIVIDSCTIINNSSRSGAGGVYCINFEGSMECYNSTISHNTTAGEGGGFYLEYGTESIISNCHIDCNVSLDTTSAVSNSGGGGIYLYGDVDEEEILLTIFNSTINGNTADQEPPNGRAEGGGIFVGENTEVEIYNTLIAGNEAKNDGGGIYVDHSSGNVDLVNVTVTGNVSREDGGGIFSDGSVTIANSVIAKNTAVAEGNDMYEDDEIINGGNNIIGNNEFGDEVEFPADNMLIGDEDNPVDPLFVECDPEDNPKGGNLRLTPCSPGINAGNNSLIEGSVDLDGEPRQFGPNVDIGAYELQEESDDTESQAGQDSTVTACAGIVLELSDFVTEPGGTFIDTMETGMLSDNEFDTEGLDPGIYCILYIIRASSGCEPDSAKITIEVLDNMTCAQGYTTTNQINFNDPCRCDNPLNEVIDGIVFLEDTLVIQAQANQTIVLEEDGTENFFDQNGQMIPDETPFQEGPPGEYKLVFYRPSGTIPMVQIRINGGDPIIVPSTTFFACECTFVPIPLMGEWAMIVLLLFALILGTVVIQKQNRLSLELLT